MEQHIFCLEIDQLQKLKRLIIYSMNSQVLYKKGKSKKYKHNIVKKYLHVPSHFDGVFDISDFYVQRKYFVLHVIFSKCIKMDP